MPRGLRAESARIGPKVEEGGDAALRNRPPVCNVPL